VIGMITESECLDLLTGADSPDPPLGVIRDHMSPPRTVGPEMDVFYVAGLFRTQDVRRFAVVAGDRLLGVITRKDVLRVLDTAWGAIR